MEVIRLDRVSLVRRTQEEFSYDLKKTLLSFLEGKYRKPTRRCVLDQINFVVESGEKVGIIGANGSGKSTLLKVICNILEPTSGTVRVRGNIAPLIELGAGFDPEISVADNIVLYGVMLGYSEQQMRRRAASILEFAELEDYATVPVKALSSGMVARLGFSIATDIQPDILILDEVLSVGDESFKNKCKQRIEQFWHDNATILLVSHDLGFLQKSCERVIWLERGRIRLQGEASEVVEAYLESVRLLDSLEKQSQVESLPDRSEAIELEAVQVSETIAAAYLESIRLLDLLEDQSQLEGASDITEAIELEAIEAETSDELVVPEPEIPTGEISLPSREQPGSVVITRVFLVNEAKQIIHTVPFSSPFYVAIEYVITAPVAKLQLGFILRDHQKRSILEPASHNWLPTTGEICELGTHCIYAKIPAPLLLPGEYFIFGAGAYEEDFGHHDHLLDYLLRFEVELTDEDNKQWFGQEVVHPMIEWKVDSFNQ